LGDNLFSAEAFIGKFDMLNFDNKNEGKWFYAVDGDEKSGGVCLRVLSPEKYQEIQKLTTKTKKKVKRGVAYDEVTTNERLESKLRWNYCIVNWTDIQLNGEPVECTKENKVELCKSVQFLSWIADCLEKLTEENNVLEEARLKNSEGSSNGSVDPTE